MGILGAVVFLFLVGVNANKATVLLSPRAGLFVPITHHSNAVGKVKASVTALLNY